MKPRHLALLFVGFIAACFFTASVTGAERRPIYSYGGKGQDLVELYADTSELCKSAELKRAVYTYRDNIPNGPQFEGTKVEGCYAIKDDKVFMIFADGDQGVMPLRVFVGREI